jgi:hypothetical protein
MGLFFLMMIVAKQITILSQIVTIFATKKVKNNDESC